SSGINMIPFFIYYSMFGFQRIGDQMWLAGDIKAKGFLLGATAGRTTLNGEGLQHEDGHSLLLASTIPTLLTYDPAFAYEIAVIIQDGMRRMYQEGEEIVYYLTLYNENYAIPPMPEGVEKGPGVFVAVSDFMKIVPEQIAPWVPGGLMTLGTDGFGRSDTRERLRRFFEVDAECTVIATLYALAEKGQVDRKIVAQAIKDLGVDSEKASPEIV